MMGNKLCDTYPVVSNRTFKGYIFKFGKIINK